MLRQRIRTDQSRVAIASRIAAWLLLLGIGYAAAVVGLLALGLLEIATGEALTGYRTAYETLARLGSEAASGTERLLSGLGGLTALVLCGYLALKLLPRPRLARSDLELLRDSRGVVTLSPRAIERAAESAALGNRMILSAQARYGSDDLTLDVSIAGAREVTHTLRDVQQRARAALTRHDIPGLPINVTLIKFDREAQRRVS